MVRPSSTPSAVLESDDLVARLLVLGLAVDAPADLDVEHVDLAVGRARLAVGAEVHATCCAPRSRPRRARRSSRRRGRCRARARRRAPTSAPGRRAARRRRRSPRACASTAHFSGSTTSVGARRGGGAREPVRGLEVAVAVGGRVELHGGGSHGMGSSPAGLTRQSIPSGEDIVRSCGSRVHGAAADRVRPPGRAAAARAHAARCAAAARSSAGAGSARSRPDAMVCAARARIGGVPVDVVGGLGRRAPARAHAAAPARADGAGPRAGAGRVDLRFEEGDGRRGRLAARRAVHLDPQAGRHADARHACSAAPFEGRGFIDDTAGYHARRTAWRWSAGVGVAESGARVAWNLVDGVHDGAAASERTVWVDGTPHHVEPQAFADDLSAVGDLRCERRRGARAPRAAARGRLGVRAAVRALQRLAAARRAAARGLGSDGAPRGAVVALCKSTQGGARCAVPADRCVPPPGGPRRRARAGARHGEALLAAGLGPAGEPWKVVLTIHQPGRAPRSDLAPAIVVRDADGFRPRYRAKPPKRPGRYMTTVVFPRGRPVDLRRSATDSRDAAQDPLRRHQGARAGRRPARPGRPARAADRVRRPAALGARGLRPHQAPPPAARGPAHPA